MDKIAQVKNEVQLKQRVEMIQSCKSSGLTVSQWCKENQISIKTYYYLYFFFTLTLEAKNDYAKVYGFDNSV